jgi:hypothetical protein
LQLIDVVFAQRVSLQPLAGFLQACLTRAGQKKQRGQATDDQERGYREVPPAESAQCFT